ncbi:MAG: LPS export ABC transporter periplasmic protein LptC [Zoogloeaceae bacterium]|jgi:lipopolysaccharide export system protein LptC|nr:LPS export ABC transporter periplasmic protein LptC [Zoogloeaceae bacterium]
MKLKPRGQGLFPIAMMSLLVGLTFWLQQMTELKGERSDALLRHDPDYYAENFSMRRFDRNGNLQNMLIAKKAVHYPDDDTMVVTEPRIAFLNRARPMHVTAAQGLVGPQGGEIALIGNVRGVRAATAKNSESVFTTTHVTVLPDDEVARTGAAVTITQGASVIRGVGMEADNKKQIYLLRSQVNSTIDKKHRSRP